MQRKRTRSHPQKYKKHKTNTVDFFVLREALRDQEQPAAFEKPLVSVDLDKLVKPDDKFGKDVFDQLMDMAKNGKKFVDFSNTLNLSERMRVHAIAEQFGVEHFSRGSNPFRYICALPRSGPRDNNFQYFGYIGLFGNIVDTIANKYISDAVPQEHRLKRIKRDGPPHHITLMTRPEIQTALKSMEEKFPELMKQSVPQDEGVRPKEDESGLKTDLQKLLKLVSEHVKGDLEPLGLGKIEGADEDADNECFFVVLNWPSASKFRNLLGLEPYDFHITLAFKSGDIHNSSQRKNKSALMDPQQAPLETPLYVEELAKMSHFLSHLNVDPKHAHSFVSLGWVCPQVLVKSELTALDMGDVGLSENDKLVVSNWMKDGTNNLKTWQESYAQGK